MRNTTLVAVGGTFQSYITRWHISYDDTSREHTCCAVWRRAALKLLFQNSRCFPFHHFAFGILENSSDSRRRRVFPFSAICLASLATCQLFARFPMQPPPTPTPLKCGRTHSKSCVLKCDFSSAGACRDKSWAACFASIGPGVTSGPFYKMLLFTSVSCGNKGTDQALAEETLRLSHSRP